MPRMSGDFPHLSKAPIVEAVIDIRIRSGKKWVNKRVKSALQKELPDYPIVEEQRRFMTEFTADPKQAPRTEIKDLGLIGFLFRTEDKLNVAQFQKEGYVFSRLKPYQDWDLFVKEAHRLWGIFCKVILPKEISRLGVRFINRIEASPGEKMDNYLINAPKPPSGFDWPFNNFFHRDVFNIPDEPYRVNYIRVLETPKEQTNFIIDIDVYIMKSLEPEQIWNEHLDRIRYYKNKVFFGSINKNLMEKMK